MSRMIIADEDQAQFVPMMGWIVRGEDGKSRRRARRKKQPKDNSRWHVNKNK